METRHAGQKAADPGRPGFRAESPASPVAYPQRPARRRRPSLGLPALRALALGALAAAALMALPSCSILPKVMLIPDPLTPEEHLQLGLAYEKDGELDLALREYEAAGNLPLAMLGRGNVLFQQGQYRRAEAAYRRLLSGDQAPEAANNLAFMLVLEGRKLDEAYRLASMAVEEGIKRHLDDDLVRNFKNTVNQAETAMMNARGGGAPAAAAPGPGKPPEGGPGDAPAEGGGGDAGDGAEGAGGIVNTGEAVAAEGARPGGGAAAGEAAGKGGK